MKALLNEPSTWPHFDKVKHFGACLIATVLFDWQFATGLAIGKETGDYFNKESKWSWLDLVADALGIGVGLIIKTIFL